MVHISKVSAIVVASAIALSGSHAQEARRLGARPASQENLVNLDLLEADADFERLLGSTHYTSYSYSYKSDKKRGTKGAKSTKPYGKGSKGAKETKPYSEIKGAKYSDYEEKGAKATKPYGKGSKGDDDDGKGKGSKGSKKSYSYDKHDKLEKVSQAYV